MLWTNCITGQQNKTQALANWCIANECIFTGKRNSSKTGWDDFVRASGLEVTAKQAKKKWHNLVQKYKELRDPPTGQGVEVGGVTAATWQWYELLDAALQGQHNISPPLVVASSSSATGGVVVTTSASTPSPTAERTGRQARKRGSEVLLDFLKEQAEKDEERERTALVREEARERGRLLKWPINIWHFLKKLSKSYK
ncbi:uncharacterized protein LOC110368872 isoform X1 [Fundulus heteroclitus]|uniref:uncharacterized protein LOC110368872 isoform X1 n=1 Tax=Fundulus heteroclitus TaxID=8078 RepID=UPI00165B99AF|nr:uncharacterized protein LOC110368872 isoform X1 [Fundulus heteroclitus]XP_036006141.1 uncharacterized protein LOC110368872 isoform X1 [Fundulus heteroclitus]XP_036006142.1 uncharacterized protein LOC110368872 isoform X1 [Fundulus heteroclitus]